MCSDDSCEAVSSNAATACFYFISYYVCLDVSVKYKHIYVSRKNESMCSCILQMGIEVSDHIYVEQCQKEPCSNDLAKVVYQSVYCVSLKLQKHTSFCFYPDVPGGPPALRKTEKSALHDIIISLRFIADISMLNLQQKYKK
jgi:hypothetical protein